MDDLLQKLSALLRAHFPQSEIEMEPRTDGRVSGFLIWEGFVGSEHIERQRMVWDLIRKELPRDEQARVIAVLTLTPEEMTAARAG
jgi:acid stress-induced BolA-like protein IbaG/YrbA